MVILIVLPHVIGNWFEDRCTSDFNNNDAANTYLPHPASNKYTTTTNQYGVGLPKDEEYKKKVLKTSFSLHTGLIFLFIDKKY